MSTTKSELCACGGKALIKNRCAECIEIAIDFNKPEWQRRAEETAKAKREKLARNKEIRDSVFEILQNLRGGDRWKSPLLGSEDAR